MGLRAAPPGTESSLRAAPIVLSRSPRSSSCPSHPPSPPTHTRAAGVIAIDLARELLQNHSNKLALVISTENITQNIYRGRQKSMLIPNVIFRCGAAAMLVSNRPLDSWRAKYKLQHLVRALGGKRALKGRPQRAQRLVYVQCVQGYVQQLAPCVPLSQCALCAHAHAPACASPGTCMPPPSRSIAAHRTAPRAAPPTPGAHHELHRPWLWLCDGAGGRGGHPWCEAVPRADEGG